MEAVILCGIQGAGKSSFYRQRFFETHLRISLDLVRTRRREEALVRACLASAQRFVVDRPIELSRAAPYYAGPAGAESGTRFEGARALSTPDVRHPIFARFYQRLSQLMERDLAERRAELLAGLSGRVVEVGAGNGMNFRHYPSTVEEVVALEPEPYLRQRAIESASSATAPVTVRDGTADRLPLEDRSVDAAIASLVLCTVPEQDSALAEIGRVLKPEGQLRFMEHVRSESQVKAPVQSFLDRSGIWPWFGGGCHCSRDTVGAIEAAGFRIERVRSFHLGPSCGPTNPHVIGVARV